MVMGLVLIPNLSTEEEGKYERKESEEWLLCLRSTGDKGSIMERLFGYVVKFPYLWCFRKGGNPINWKPTRENIH